MARVCCCNPDSPPSSTLVSPKFVERAPRHASTRSVAKPRRNRWPKTHRPPSAVRGNDPDSWPTQPAGPGVLPTVSTLLAAWGPATVKLNGKPFDNPYDGAFRPQWDGHLMVTEGVRQPDGTVRTLDGSLYDPSLADQGFVDHDDLEVHLVFHDARFPIEDDNFPPLFQFFYHLVFEQVSLEIAHHNPEGDQ